MELHSETGMMYSSCVNCKEPMCIHYYEEEYECIDFSNFAEYQNRDVCAFSAIMRNGSSGCIAINDDACVRCGLCASRCPYGAIYYSQGKMVVRDERNDARYRLITTSENVVDLQRECIEQLNVVQKNSKHEVDAMERVRSVYARIKKSKPDNTRALLYCRNLLIEMGFNCALSRTGIAAMRMDAVYSSKGRSGAVEIEFYGDSLSTARDILDDVAMMQERLGLNSKDNTPIALFWQIPNTRQNYYQVCDDIRRVLGVKIRTLTIAALMLLMWDGARLEFDDSSFCLAFRDTSIKADVEALLGRDINDDNLAGYLEPIK
ncbi:MAG: 4Fe-4S binding protein [Atopobiaceae bacterium]|nr:4Fe-4S binding protein [Atopobiaceae bacterium]